MRVILGAVLLLAPAAFAEKLCIAPFKGPGASTVRGQLTANLCDSNACVDPKKATKGGKPDFSKGKREKIDFFITGTVKAKGSKKTLELQVLSKPRPPKLKKSFTYTGNALPDRTLEQAIAALNKAMGLEAKAEPKEEPPPREEPKKEEPAEEKEEAEEAPEPEKKPDRREKVKDPEEPPPPPKEEERARSEEEEEPAAPRKPIKDPIVAIEAGVDLFSRNFSYNAPETNNLRSYSAGLVVAPAFRLEAYPLALFTKGFLAGIGLDGSFAFAVGLKSRRSGTDVTWPTSIVRWDASVRYRFRPVESVDAAVIPFVGYSSRSFSVGTGTDGSTLDGLPNVAYTAIRPGIAGELPFSDSGFLIFAKFAVQIVLSNGQIISSAADGFFRRGSNFGIEGQLGAGYRIFGPLSIRLAFDFVRYGLGFSPEPTDTYRAGGAVDTYLGGNLAVRLTF